jgi:predicted ATP-dependent endonuclease of OLD family
MKISCVEITNFRKLKSTHIDFDCKTTIFVGANNSGKTSAMVALRYFLLAPDRLALRDVTISNWAKFDEAGRAWESNTKHEIDLDGLLPVLDVWLDVPLTKIQYVVHILPTLDWRGGALGVRLKYQFKDIGELKADYLLHRNAALAIAARGKTSEAGGLEVWPRSLTDYFERRLRGHLVLESYALDPALLAKPDADAAIPQKLRDNALPLNKNPFKGLIRIDEIAAQRDFADAGEKEQGEASGTDPISRRFKRKLSDQLRVYYDRHLDPNKTPDEDDYDALGAIQKAERRFDNKLKFGFGPAIRELEDLGYPGIANPKLRISTQLRATDGLKHGTAIQYEILDPAGDGGKPFSLPEDYSGLGYQNLVAMVFMLMGFRDGWMRIGKAATDVEAGALEQVERLHLVLVEEPEAHLHAQVQQVFINKAYKLLRKHDELGERETLCTQLIVSTHSSHVAHEADFASLRYFRRRPAKAAGETPTSTVANLSSVFGDVDETHRFVKRYLKATHCDLFFADGIIFAEGQAERILIPHFIRHHFESLSRRYISLIDLGGSHAHSFKELVDVLGLGTLVIADLDATAESKVTLKDGTTTTRWKAVRPARGAGQKTSNPVLKSWHPKKETIDDLLNLKSDQQRLAAGDGWELYVAFQKPVTVTNADKTKTEIIPRTFEDALILENHKVLEDISGSPTSRKIQEICRAGLTGDDLEEELFDLLKKIEKAEFAIDCLTFKNAKALVPPAYIREGLAWFEKVVSEEIAAKDQETVSA